MLRVCGREVGYNLSTTRTFHPLPVSNVPCRPKGPWKAFPFLSLIRGKIYIYIKRMVNKNMAYNLASFKLISHNLPFF